MRELKRRLKIFLSLFFLLTLTGTAGFMVLEDLSLAEAFYYKIVTMSTVGYGDIYPTTQASRNKSVYIGISRSSHLMKKIEVVESAIRTMINSGKVKKTIEEYYTSRNLPVPAY